MTPLPARAVPAADDAVTAGQCGTLVHARLYTTSSSQG